MYEYKIKPFILAIHKHWEVVHYLKEFVLTFKKEKEKILRTFKKEKI